MSVPRPSNANSATAKPARLGAQIDRAHWPPCVVVGLHQNGLGVARALGRHGVRVIAVDGPQRDAYAATRFASRVACPDLRGVGLIRTLEQIGRSLDRRAVLILTLDRSVLLVSEHRAAIEPWFVHSLPDDVVVQRLMHKSETERFARAHGFAVPRTYTIRSEADLKACLGELQFPCILKPEEKTVEFVERSPKKAFRVRSMDELREIYHLVTQWEPAVVIQEWVPGPETNLVFCLYYFDRDGKPVASFTGRKIRQFIPHCGTACSAEPWEDERVRDAGVRFFGAAGYRGFGAIEFKIAPDGRYYLIEPTVGRTEHLFALAAANGVNLPLIGYCDMAGLPRPESEQSKRRVVYVDWRRDLRAARTLVDEGELTWATWAKSVARFRQHALFAWDDPAPAVRQMLARVRSASTRMRQRVRRQAARAYDSLRDRMSAGIDVGAARRPYAEPLGWRAHVDAALDWLCAAQDATGGGGVARGFACSTRSGYAVGWQPAYPETTGYIIPTVLELAARLDRPDLRERALRMADWILSLQLENGGFPGGTVDRRPSPVVFNTGMVLLGLIRVWQETERPAYADAIARAAEFLRAAQSEDGAWRRFSNADGGVAVHAYDCLVTWGLLQAARSFGESRWLDAAVRNLHFTLTLQAPNGWFAFNALRPHKNGRPLTHTIGYVTAGLLESGVLLGEPRFVDAAERTARAVLGVLGADGFLAGELDAEWRPAAEWSCLTGTAQMAVAWWRLFELRGDPEYAGAARRAAAYVMCRQEVLRGAAGTRGGVAGSFPIDAPYGRFQFVNWAPKFLLDALILEDRLGDRGRSEMQAAAAPVAR